MDARTAAVATVITLGICHLRVRRHLGWVTPTPSSSTARFYFSTGYPAVVVGVFWLAQTTSASSWEWAAGSMWALAGSVLLIRGFDLINQAAGIRPRPYLVPAERIKLHR